MLWRNTSRIVLPEIDPGAAGALPIAEAGYDLPVVDCAADPFTDLVLSWNAVAPPGTALRCAARVRHAPLDGPGEALWSAWYDLGHWGPGATAAGPLPRSAAPGTDDAAVRLAVDTLRLADGREGTAFQARVTLYGGDAGPALERLTVSTTHRGAPVAPADDPPLGRPVALTVPARSQCRRAARDRGRHLQPDLGGHGAGVLRHPAHNRGGGARGV